MNNKTETKTETGKSRVTDLIDQVLEAKSRHEPLKIVGGGSKDFLGRKTNGKVLSVRDHSGVVDYSPTELVMTARAGTPLVELISLLDQHQQMLAFEPPVMNGQATLGGTLGANCSGPARPWRGSVRDAVLGVRLINGEGQHLRFGGVVMKNVAGYDLSRAQAGAMGTLGVITEVSMKVLPKPALEKTLVFQLSQSEAIEKLCKWQRQPKPLSGAVWVNGQLYLRVAGAEQAVEGTIQQWGGDVIASEASQRFWSSIKEQSHEFFGGTQPLWRISLKSSAGVVDENMLLDWGGALRWTRQEASLDQIAQQCRPFGGLVSLYRDGDREAEVHAPMPEPLKRLHQQLKQSLDPYGIFNPGRLYSWL
ncbi:glycolate oxidase subunit GlcE [Hahella ganghwensis]|uniref:glycolate oxidase subunit GlcE n=1 Tax=Hahella ganghwensis TaxID=286420 RepID=UPI000366D471|nr:glycolate oxidase subunit GlcE [Hahella ganghwensis]